MQPIEYQDVSVKLPDLKTYYKRVERHLTFVETRLLLILISEPEKVFQSDELVKRTGLTTKDSLTKYIFALRNMLDQHYIHTHHGFGYSFATKSGEVSKARS